MDNLRLYVRGGTGGMSLPRLGGLGGNGGDVWVVAKKNMTLKKVKEKYPLKRFQGGPGGNSRSVSPNTTLALNNIAHLHMCMPPNKTLLNGFIFYFIAVSEL